MKQQNILPLLTTIFRQTFDNDKISLKLTTTADDIEGWDSFMHINLIVAVERKFGINFKTGETEELTNVGDFVHMIEKKTG